MKITKVLVLSLFAVSFSAACMGCCGMCRASEVSEAQQQMLDDIAAKKYALQRDADLAHRLAQQDLDSQRRRAVVAEQQRLLDDVGRKKRQEQRDAELAQRIAEQELYEQNRRAIAEQERLFAQAVSRQKQEQRDAELAQRIAQQELARVDNAKKQQIASDAALAQQLQAEEFSNARLNHAAPAPARRQAVMTSALPVSASANNLKNWTQSNDVVPRDTAPNDVLCAVCISTPQELEGNQMVKLPCKHVFCRACTHGLVANQTGMLACPTCRDKSDVASVRALVR